MTKEPVKPVTPGQRMATTDATTNKDLYESGAMPKGVYEKLDPRERTGSHPPKHGPYSREVRKDLTADQFKDPNLYNKHTGQLTPRGEHEADFPEPGRTFRSAPKSQTGVTGFGNMDPAYRKDVEKWVDKNDEIQIGPTDTSWGQDDTWQNRRSQFAQPVTVKPATVKDLPKNPAGGQ
jgi:hypothetical protein